jgi:glycosyltransferase involved in cell wall biosynthesis
MTKLRKLLPGAKREPKILVVFSNRKEDCDRLIRHLSRRVANSPVAAYPIHVYCLEKPFEEQRCAHVVVDPNPRSLYRRAQQELANSWVALSATSWNNLRYGTLLKLIPLTIPPFRGLVGNENGDIFELRLLPVALHMINRGRQRVHKVRADLAHWVELRVVWPTRHGRAWFRKKVKDKIVWGTAVALGKMAWFAERIVPFTRGMFSRLPKGEPSPIAVDPSSLDPNLSPGITRIEYRDLEWRREEIAALIEASRSRFILFCPPDYVDPFDDFLPLFQDPLTFAVTRQRGYREWRPIMVTLSPFRILKPKEASRVAAPLAAVVLVDRRKLLKLAIPKTLVFGAAWLSLFWRAGAAGWRSYSVGGTGAVQQQLDYWLEEMLFVKHLYLDPDLQRLANEAPLLCRGNITFRPGLSRPYRALPRVLVVAPYLPFPLSHGGAVRIYNLCKALAEKVDFILICFREITDVVDYEELHTIFRQVYVVDRDEITTNPDLPRQVNHYETSSMRALIAGVAREQQVDLLQIEYTDLAAYREAVPQRPAILVEHDITYTLHRQFTERDQSEAVVQEYQRWRKFETERLRAFDSVFVMSEQDQDEAVTSGANRQRTYVIPNGVDLQRFRALPPAQGETEVFYVGSFRHLPNYLGFEELRGSIMPLVWEKFPNAVLRVVAGPDHEKHWRNALQGAAIPHLDPRIIIHGFVSDLSPLYQTAHVVAVPLPLSAGTNIKVMEALSCQRAVVTTPVGAQGLALRDETDAVICGLGQPFADAICHLIENPLLRDEIARAGRATAEARFGWNAIANDALDVYSLLIRESRAQRAPGNGRQREQQKNEEHQEDNHRSEGRGILERA